jgi:putative DNA methylase
MSPPLYGMTKQKDLFTARQLVALNTFSTLLSKARKQIASDAATIKDSEMGDGLNFANEYANNISVYLSFIIDKLADLGNSLCPWEPVAECPRNLFGRQLVSMSWNFAEGNVLGNSSGSWNILLANFCR